MKEISQAEKRKILAEDRARLATYHAVAQGSIDDERGGRFAVTRPTTVTGTSPAMSYPRQPEDSPANQMAMMPPEPSLGYSINDQEVVGEAFEAAAQSGSRPSDDGDVLATGLRKSWRRL